jgi:hypothetical protein
LSLASSALITPCPPPPWQATLKLLGQVDTQKLSQGTAHKFGLNVIVKV